MNTASTHSLYFHQATKIITIKQGNQHRTIFRTLGMPLAEQQSNGHNLSLLAVEGKGTVLRAQQVGQDETHSYSAYGHDPRLPSMLTLLGFNGEAFFSLQSDYALGNGHRSFSPARMRFSSPDSLSPFGRGGLNAYCYCEGDPVNNIDPSGRSRVFLPNGQILRFNKNKTIATPAGRWLGPSTRTRTTSLETLNYSPAPHPARRASFAGAYPVSPQVQAFTPSAPTRTVALQRVSPIQTDTHVQLAEWVTRAAKREPILPASTAGAKPTAIIKPIQSTQVSNQRVRLDISDSSSATTSRDSTPPQSRSVSPTSALTLPYHVQVAVNFRNNRTFDP